MNSTTINHRLQGNIHTAGSAVVEVLASLHNLVAGVWAQAFTRTAVKSVAQTVQQDAEALREYAETFVQSDPGFAQDLFMAADRCERAAKR